MNNYNEWRAANVMRQSIKLNAYCVMMVHTCITIFAVVNVNQSN